MTTPPLTPERRLELLEHHQRAMADLLSAEDRLPQGTGKRWTYWAVTSLPYEGSYPGEDGDNTFPIRFIDPAYTPIAGAQAISPQLHSTFPRTVARTTNGQWCLPGELVMASPLPPPYGTTNKGRWLITPVKTYYYGKLNEPLTQLGSAVVSVYKQTPAGTWVDTLYDQTVWDSGFLGDGETLEANEWVRFEWETCAWVVTLTGVAPPGIKRFELLETLSLTGHAKAKLKQPDAGGGDWEDTDPVVEIEVYDPYRPEGMWNGLAGYQGFAVPRGETYTDPGEDPEDEEDDEERAAYDIVWMERPAQLLRFTSVGPMASGEMPVAVNWFDWQGKDPGSTITVYDPAGMFPDVHSGAQGLAYYNNKSSRYEVLRSDRVVMRGYATLTADCCGTSASIENFVGEPTGEFVGTPPELPTTAANPSNHAGLTGARVELERISNTMPALGWKVVSITQVLVHPIVAVRLNGLNFEYRTANWYVELCTTELNDWQVWHEGDDECPAEEV